MFCIDCNHEVNFPEHFEKRWHLLQEKHVVGEKEIYAFFNLERVRRLVDKFAADPRYGSVQSCPNRPCFIGNRRYEGAHTHFVNGARLTMRIYDSGGHRWYTCFAAKQGKSEGIGIPVFAKKLTEAKSVKAFLEAQYPAYHLDVTACEVIVTPHLPAEEGETKL